MEKRHCKICNAILSGYNKTNVCFCHNEKPDDIHLHLKVTCCSSRGNEKFLYTYREYNGGYCE